MGYWHSRVVVCEHVHRATTRTLPGLQAASLCRPHGCRTRRYILLVGGTTPYPPAAAGVRRMGGATSVAAHAYLLAAAHVARGHWLSRYDLGTNGRLERLVRSLAAVGRAWCALRLVRTRG